MVVAYDMNWLSWQIMSRMAKVDTVTLVNLVTGQKAVPEFLGPACKPDAIAGALNGLIGDADLQAAQAAAMAETMVLLGRGAELPGLRAARAVLQRCAVIWQLSFCRNSWLFHRIWNPCSTLHLA